MFEKNIKLEIEEAVVTSEAIGERSGVMTAFTFCEKM